MTTRGNAYFKISRELWVLGPDLLWDAFKKEVTLECELQGVGGSFSAARVFDEKVFQRPRELGTWKAVTGCCPLEVPAVAHRRLPDFIPLLPPVLRGMKSFCVLAAWRDFAFLHRIQTHTIAEQG